MTALFEGLTHWHWLGLGFVLLAIEVMGSVGFLLWTGIAALEVGLLLLVWPFGWQAQLLLFALQSLLTTLTRLPAGSGALQRTVQTVSSRCTRLIPWLTSSSRVSSRPM